MVSSQDDISLSDIMAETDIKIPERLRGTRIARGNRIAPFTLAMYNPPRWECGASAWRRARRRYWPAPGWACAAFGLAWRVAVVRSWYQVFYPEVENEEGYYEAGVTLGSCGVLAQAPELRPTAFRAPAFPAFLAAAEAPFSKPRPGHARLAL